MLGVTTNTVLKVTLDLVRNTSLEITKTYCGKGEHDIAILVPEGFNLHHNFCTMFVPQV